MAQIADQAALGRALRWCEALTVCTPDLAACCCD
jgi:hypothetical protein